VDALQLEIYREQGSSVALAAPSSTGHA